MNAIAIQETDRIITVSAAAALGALIQERPQRVRVHTPEEQVQAVTVLLKGIVDWLTDEPTLAASIIEDVARMIARCEDGEELRDLSVQIRQLMFRFKPDASRVALTADEARVLHAIN